MEYVWSILQGRAEFLARKAHVDGGNQERENTPPTPPRIHEESVEVWEYLPYYKSSFFV
jgi:hypothetical protein